MNKVNKFFRTTGLIIFAALFSVVIFVMLIFSKIFNRKKKTDSSN